MADDEAPEAKKKSPLILFIIIAVVLVGASIGGTVFIMSGSGDDASSDVAEEEDLGPPALYYALLPKLQTNYDVNGRPRLFQLAVSFKTREQDVIDALSLHAPVIKSNYVILLSGQKFETLGSPEGREALRAELLIKVQEILNTEIGKPGVEQVLFTDFVLQ